MSSQRQLEARIHSLLRQLEYYENLEIRLQVNASRQRHLMEALQDARDRGAICCACGLQGGWHTMSCPEASS